MPNRTVLLIHHDPDLRLFFRRGFEKTGARLLAMRDGRGLSGKKSRIVYAVYVVEAHEACVSRLRQLDLPEGKRPWVIIAPGALLRDTFDLLRPQILEVIHHISGSPAAGSTGDAAGVRAQAKASREPFLQEYFEKRLQHFVRQMKAGDGRDLHALLVHEVEKPLISLTLKETGGNQIHAARLLGMNRNTLRKKIKTLRISIKSSS